jgi:hypothetical protein
MWKAPLFILLRLGILALGGWICHELAIRMGAPLAIAIWAAAIGAACGLTALAMHRVPIGKVGFANYLAGIVLPFGYHIGKGKLLPIVLVSWAVWTAAGAAVAILSASGYDPRAASADGSRHITILTILLWISWIADAMAILYLLRVLTTRLGFASRSAPQMMLFIGILIAMIAGSALMWSFGMDWQAVTLAGGPILFLGGSYGLFLSVLLITKPRWN